jgi:hypothetical protein
LFSWYLLRLHDLEEAKKNLGRIDKASAVAVGDINQSNSFTSGDSDSDDLDGADLELEVDVEFMVQTLFWTIKRRRRYFASLSLF